MPHPLAQLLNTPFPEARIECPSPRPVPRCIGQNYAARKVRHHRRKTPRADKGVQVGQHTSVPRRTEPHHRRQSQPQAKEVLSGSEGLGRSLFNQRQWPCGPILQVTTARSGSRFGQIVQRGKQSAFSIGASFWGKERAEFTVSDAIFPHPLKPLERLEARGLTDLSGTGTISEPRTRRDA